MNASLVLNDIPGFPIYVCVLKLELWVAAKKESWFLFWCVAVGGKVRNTQLHPEMHFNGKTCCDMLNISENQSLVVNTSLWSLHEIVSDFSTVA